MAFTKEETGRLRFEMLIEEYKTIREEIARYENQQKQSLAAGIGAIALAILSASAQKDQLNLYDRPYLFLLLPLILIPISFIYYGNELGIVIAARYLGINLKEAARKLCGSLDGVWDWENYVSRFSIEHESASNYYDGIVFFWPSPACLLGFLYCIVFQRPKMTLAIMIGHIVIAIVDIVLFITLYRFRQQIGKAWESYVKDLAVYMNQK